MRGLAVFGALLLAACSAAPVVLPDLGLPRDLPLGDGVLVADGMFPADVPVGTGDAVSPLDGPGPSDRVPPLDGPPVDGPPAALDCLGPALPLVRSGLLPYVEVAIDAARGDFLVDFATTFSSLDPGGFRGGVPQPVGGTADVYEGFEFFGPWDQVTLVEQDFSGFSGAVRQAGILGTDFLSLHAFTLDFDAGLLHRADPGQLCDDARLAAAGLLPLSTAGFYSGDPSSLPAGRPNVPVVPVRLGTATAPAQLDSGYDDALVGPALNINRAYFQAIAEGGTTLERASELDLSLSTCVPGVSEPIRAYRPPAGAPLELVGVDDAAVRELPGAVIFLKDTPPEAARCGGIGVSPDPGAQLGVRALVDAGRVLIDPVSARVWLSRAP